MTLIVAAMKEEVEEILKIKTKDTEVIITGIGKVNAAMQLSSYLATHKVDKVINLGFAGGNIAYDINDIVIIDQALYHDFDLTLFGYEKGQVPGYPKVFLTDEKLKESIKTKLQKAKTGILYTGDYFMIEPVEQPAVFDMEGASLYHVAHHFNIPIISVKVVSDVIGMKDHYKNYKTFEQTQGAHLLADVFKDIIGGI